MTKNKLKLCIYQKLFLVLNLILLNDYKYFLPNVTFTVSLSLSCNAHVDCIIKVLNNIAHPLHHIYALVVLHFRCNNYHYNLPCCLLPRHRSLLTLRPSRHLLFTSSAKYFCCSHDIFGYCATGYLKFLKVMTNAAYQPNKGKNCIVKTKGKYFPSTYNIICFSFSPFLYFCLLLFVMSDTVHDFRCFCIAVQLSVV